MLFEPTYKLFNAEKLIVNGIQITPIIKASNFDILHARNQVTVFIAKPQFDRVTHGTSDAELVELLLNYGVKYSPKLLIAI